MQKIKEFFNDIKAKIILILTGISAILGFILYWKFKKHDDLSIEISNANSQKKLDLIEADINQRKEEIAGKKGQIKELEEASNKLKEKRNELDKQTPSEKQVLDHWNQ